MAENLDSAVNSLSERTKKYDLALYYTHGSEERAKQMISGSYKDVYVVKVKFTSSTIYGAFMFFFNGPYSNLTSEIHILSNSFAVDDIKSNIPWREFEKQIDENLKLNEHDDVFGNQLKEALQNNFVMI